jgi:hypothetical protein
MHMLIASLITFAVISLSASTTVFGLGCLASVSPKRVTPTPDAR